MQQNEQEPNQIQNVVDQARQEVESGRVPEHRARQHTAILIVVYFILFAVFMVLAVFVHIHPVLPIDVAITRDFQTDHAPWLYTLMNDVSYLGYHPFVFTGLIVVTALLFWMVRLRLEAILVIAQSAVSAALNVLIKILVNRPRPTSHLVDVFRHVSGQSFPSGHVMSYVAFWGLLFSLGLILFKRNRWWHYVLLIIPALFVILIGPSRVYLGAHWASDVLGAYLFGGILLGIFLWIYLVLKTRGVLQTEAKSKNFQVVPKSASAKPVTPHPSTPTK